MKKSTFTPGRDQKAISRVAKALFGGSHMEMFEYHGWLLELGRQHMQQAATRIVECYANVQTFEVHFLAEGKE